MAPGRGKPDVCDRGGDLVHGVRAEQHELRTGRLQRLGVRRQQLPRPRPVTGDLEPFDLGEVDREQQLKDPVLLTPRKLGAVPWTGP